MTHWDTAALGFHDLEGIGYNQDSGTLFIVSTAQVPTLTPTNTPQATDQIFADGFETGDLSAWSSSVIDAGDLSVSAADALAGSQGLQAMIDDNGAISVTNDAPNTE